MKFLTTGLMLLTFVGPAAAETLLQTDRSWDGGEFSYPEGQPQVTSVRLRLASGEKTPMHCHPVPTFAYVLRGELEVETAAGERTRLQAGDPVVEVMHRVHRGRAVEGPVEIVVFYAGSKQLPTTVLADDPASGRHCG